VVRHDVLVIGVDHLQNLLARSLNFIRLTELGADSHGRGHNRDIWIWVPGVAVLAKKRMARAEGKLRI